MDRCPWGSVSEHPILGTLRRPDASPCKQCEFPRTSIPHRCRGRSLTIEPFLIAGSKAPFTGATGTRFPSFLQEVRGSFARRRDAAHATTVDSDGLTRGEWPQPFRHEPQLRYFPPNQLLLREAVDASGSLDELREPSRLIFIARFRSASVAQSGRGPCETLMIEHAPRVESPPASGPEAAALPHVRSMPCASSEIRNTLGPSRPLRKRPVSTAAAGP